MKNITLIFCFVLLISCDRPQQIRYDGLGGTYTADPFQDNQNTTTTTTTGGDTNFNTTQEDDLGPGFQFCNLNPIHIHYTADMGYFAVCQSDVSESQFVLKMKESDFSQGTCIIPMNRAPNGTSVYLGAAQCTYHAANQVMRGTLHKNRTGFETMTINSVMIMKRTTLTSFFACMDAVKDFVHKNCPACPNSCSSQSWYQCQNAAQAEMARLCNYFESQGNYMQISF